LKSLNGPVGTALSAELSLLAHKNLLRELRPLTGPQSAMVTLASMRDRPMKNFSANDYLGLAGHPALREAACLAVEKEGAGSGASRLVCGSLPAHEELEDALARFKRSPSALAFSSGYAAALGTLTALVGRGDTVLLDKLSHACLVDAAKLSGATIRVFPHNNTEILAKKLAAVRSSGGGRVLIVAESVYSMDGDVAPLREIIDLKERFGAWLFLDEAHGVGVLGDCGRGLAEAAGLADQVEIQMGTLGKALGSSGAYICGCQELRDLLINRARSFIFSTAPAPPTAAAATAAIHLLSETPEGPRLISRLHQNIAAFCTSANRPVAPAAIVPVIAGSAENALALSKRLMREGFLVPAIRYPTVPRGAARLRVTLSASHSTQDACDLGRLVCSEACPADCLAGKRAFSQDFSW
jgi:8-amino-7-oxononanoate synthase